MSKFHSLKVSQINRETNDCVEVIFDVPSDLTDQYQFLHGQYLTLKAIIKGEEVRRSYSICTSPTEKKLAVAIKKVPNGVFSSYANENLKIGDTLEVMTPMGRFTHELNPTAKRRYLLVAAGSGITPILSILKTVLVQEPNSHVTLMYGNQSRGSIIFKSQLETLKNRYMERLSLYHILSRERGEADILCGRINEEKCNYFINNLLDVKTLDHAFICGPEEMIHSVKNTLIRAGMPEKQVHFELFATAASIANQSKKEAVHTDLSNDEKSKVTIKLDGTYLTFDLAYHGESILDAALRKGADLPFACKGGVCCTCRAKVTSGLTEMDVNYGLEPDELEAGFVLSCQAHPRASEVSLDFDV